MNFGGTKAPKDFFVSDEADEEYDRFDLDDEFEGGEFGEDGEYYYKAKKRAGEDGSKRRRMTKEQ